MKTCLPVLLSVVLSACAMAPDDPSAPREERVYRTGSNIPVKDPSSAAGVQTQDPSTLQNQIPPNMQRPRGASGG